MAEILSTKLLPYGKLRDYFLKTEPRNVYHVLPAHVAAELDVPPRLALETLVEAMFQGDAVLHWELQCPYCKGRGDAPNLLRHTLHDHVCGACGMTFDVHLDHEAQIAFSPHPNLRALGEEADDEAYRKELRKECTPTTAHELMTIQRFREWARNEPFPTGEYLDVSRLTLWFSDLTGSTAIYARNGDPFAYHLVREHFDVISAAVQDSQGALVKTIGDGVMAVFSDAQHAFQAALRANRELEAFNEGHDLRNDRQLLLKVGIHTGPAIVVTLNDRLDYFGTTVNVASRVSNLALGQEIVLTESSYAEIDVPALASDLPLDRFRTPIRGLDDPIVAYRLRLKPEEERVRPGFVSRIVEWWRGAEK